MNINEIFTCLQGEGKTIGQSRLLIRFNGCNLKCSFCDTKYTWGYGDTNIDLKFYNDLLKNNKYWMITGGEPMLHQTDILELINKYKPKFVEIETNGTFKALPELLKKIDLFNISPKESKDQISSKVDVTPILLHQKDEMKDYILKFVITSNNKDSLIFTEDISTTYKIKKNKIYLMPLSNFNKEKDKEFRKEVYNIASNLGYNFSPRLHVLLFNEERDK